ncbi:MAG TPA: DUF1926 domain-containing protein, partial [Firmicutes bacterium]|nr:DUF1926 domain-containing protein [Bacillota bacterium]
LDTLTRRPEKYHQQLAEQASTPKPPEKEAVSIHHLQKVKEEGLMEHLHYDPYPRVALVEHFLSSGVSLEEFINANYQEPGGFLMQPATAQLVPLPANEDSSGQPGIKVIFRRNAGLDEQGPLILEKLITLYAGQDGISVDYTLHNTGPRPITYWFAVEFNLAMMGGYDEQRWFEIPGRELRERHLASAGSEDQVEQVSLHDHRRSFKFTLQFEKAAQLWRAPIETVSLSEGGLERVYQQSMILPRWEIDLPPEKSWSVGLKMILSSSTPEQERDEEPLRREVGV